jgi:hypothetical protein
MSAKHDKQARRERRRGETRNDRHIAKIRMQQLRAHSFEHEQRSEVGHPGLTSGSWWDMDHMAIGGPRV